MEAFMITESSQIDPQIGANLQYLNSLKHTIPLHYHEYFEFFLITSGKCNHIVNQQKQHLVDGALVFIRPNDQHCYKSVEQSDCTFINIAISADLIDKTFNFLEGKDYLDNLITSNLPHFVMLSFSEKVNFINLYEKVKAIYSIDKPSTRMLLKSFIVEIFSKYFAGIQNNGVRDIPLWLESVVIQMQKKENFIEGLKRMYTLSDRSQGHLNRAFKQYLNTTPTEYVNQLRLAYAKDLIVSTNSSIIEIAIEAGFQTVSHFNHLFKQQYKLTPSSMRKSHLS